MKLYSATSGHFSTTFTVPCKQTLCGFIPFALWNFTNLHRFGSCFATLTVWTCWTEFDKYPKTIFPTGMNRIISKLTKRSLSTANIGCSTWSRRMFWCIEPISKMGTSSHVIMAENIICICYPKGRRYGIHIQKR